jgi:hypothetical protein
MYICNVLLNHKYHVFILFILEYIDISNLSSGPGPEKTRKSILEREQYSLNIFMLKYNILEVIGFYLALSI